jgi:hypothetical protein
MVTVFAALIGAGASIVAALLGYWSSNRRTAALEKLAELERMKAVVVAEDDKRSLSPAELEAIKVQRTVKDQLLDAPSVVQTNQGEVQVKVVYAGGDRFRSYSNYSDRRDESVRYSELTVALDGQRIGGGSGERGFSLDFSVPVGRHTLMFSWTGRSSTSRTRYDGTTRDYDDDLSGRHELVFWAVGGGRCLVHLDKDFAIDHAEPGLILATCHACRMPGVYRCKCQRKYCGEHAEQLDGKAVCSFCKNQAIEAEQQRIKKAEEERRGAIQVAIGVLIVVAIAAGIAAYYFGTSK